MPPHARMNVAQQLVLRALIAWFWRTPYRGGLERFGTALNDRFMLPYFLREDFNQVLAEVSNGTGVKLEPAWFDAQHEFRFPLLGTLNTGDISLELRTALEPWHVLGEEGTAEGTARFVDSSLERVEARIQGLDEKRYALACNGIRVPLTDLSDDGKIAGVRFRAWLPASCLHPTIFPHGPLVFDIYDLDNARAVAGCTYHAVHPGGRNYELQPVNALEADGRRQSRFHPFGSAPGAYALKEPTYSDEFSTTLDLRRC